jgi:hypothetical protein
MPENPVEQLLDEQERKELIEGIARKVFAGSLRGLSHALVQRGYLSEARQLMAMYLKVPVFEKKPG